jgi:tripartite-type tricarboxylate transporter receptor subunit TctC
VSPKLGVDTLQDFIALAKAKPGTLNFGSSGVGNSIHLAVEQFNAAVGIKAVHVPFDGQRDRYGHDCRRSAVHDCVAGHFAAAHPGRAHQGAGGDGRGP